MKNLILWLILLSAFPALSQAPPVLRNSFTTNAEPAARNVVTQIVNGASFSLGRLGANPNQFSTNNGGLTIVSAARLTNAALVGAPTLSYQNQILIANDDSELSFLTVGTGLSLDVPSMTLSSTAEPFSLGSLGANPNQFNTNGGSLTLKSGFMGTNAALFGISSDHQVRATNGLVSNPPYSFQGFTNYGMWYNQPASALAFAHNGVTVLSLNSGVMQLPVASYTITYSSGASIGTGTQGVAGYGTDGITFAGSSTAIPIYAGNIVSSIGSFAFAGPGAGPAMIRSNDLKTVQFYGANGISDTPGSGSIVASNHLFKPAGGLVFVKGTSMRAGYTNLTAGTVTIGNVSVTTNTLVMTSRKTLGTLAGFLSYSVAAGTSFTITSSQVTDDGEVAWMLVEAQR